MLNQTFVNAMQKSQWIIKNSNWHKFRLQSKVAYNSAVNYA